MASFVIRRLVQSIIVLVLVSIVVFAALRLAPGDPAQMMLGSAAVGPEAEARLVQIRHQLGLDEPVHIQYFRWLGGIAEGDLGRSVRTNGPVLPIILDRLPATV